MSNFKNDLRKEIEKIDFSQFEDDYITKRDDAVDHIVQCKGLIEVLKMYPDYAIEIKVCDTQFGLCDNKKVIEMLENEIVEAKKCIDKQPNKFE